VKKNMIKLALASVALLMAMGTQLSASANSNVESRCQTLPDGSGCGVTGSGRAWWELNGNQASFHSIHNMREHRALGRVGGNSVNSNWRNRNIQSNSARVTRPAGVNLSVSLDTR